MPNKPTIKTINVADLKNQYDSSSNFYLIDVRELSEWHEAHIPKATLISLDDLKENIKNTVPNKSATIYLHCRSGKRSLQAAETLLDLGYTDVYSVDGGIIAWAASGFPTIVID